MIHLCSNYVWVFLGELNKLSKQWWPFTRPHAEAELYKRQLDEAIAKHGGSADPIFALMRHTAVYDNQADRDEAINSITRVLGQFENLYRNLDDVTKVTTFRNSGSTAVLQLNCTLMSVFKEIVSSCGNRDNLTQPQSR